MSLAMMDDQFENYAEGRVVPPVEPEAIKRRRNLEQAHSSEDMRAACARDSGAVMVRYGMIQMLIHLKLLAPWQHGEELDDGVYRVAATFPMRVFSNRVYKVAGDDIFPFDPNAFVQRLVEETGISHTWDPIPTKIGEDDFVYSRVTVTTRGKRAESRIWNGKQNVGLETCYGTFGAGIGTLANCLVRAKQVLLIQSRFCLPTS